MGPDYVRPDPPLPAGWQTEPAGFAGASAAPVGRWWDAFGDPELSSLVERATVANRDLAQAAGRVAEAQALYRATRSAQFPSLDSDADVAYQRSSVNALFPGGTDDTLYGIGVSASWEVDLFGRVRRSVESSDARFEGSDEDQRDVLIAVIAEVAAAYVDVRTVQQRLAVARANLESQSRIVELTRDPLRGRHRVVARRGTGGEHPGQHAHRDPAARGAARAADEPPERAARREPGSARRRARATRADPGATRGADRAAAGGHGAPAPRHPLRRAPARGADRADRRRDRRPLSRASPCSAPSASTRPTQPSSSRARAAATRSGPSVRWNVFDAGRIRALIGAEQARAVQALAFYEQTILLALEEVENALVTYARLQEERAASADAIAAATLSLELATALYKDGIVDFQNVLDAQRTLLVFEDQLARVDGASVQSLVQLYRALGGGWSALEPPIEVEGASQNGNGNDDDSTQG